MISSYFSCVCHGVPCTMKKLTEELTQALVEARDADSYGGRLEDSFLSFEELVEEMTSKHQDIKAFAFKTKAMVHHTSFILMSLGILQVAIVDSVH